MSIVVDIFAWLFIETILGFIFYSTGCVILKVISFGQYKIQFRDYASYKDNKSGNVTLVCLLGLSFYILLIGVLAYLNN